MDEMEAQNGGRPLRGWPQAPATAASAATTPSGGAAGGRTEPGLTFPPDPPVEAWANARRTPPAPAPSPAAAPARRGALREGAAIALAFAVLYAVVGYAVVVDGHVVVFASLDRLARALMVWHNDPAKLAAIGFTFAPLSTLAFLPLAIVKPLASSLVALPLASAIPAGGAMAMLNAALARCGLARALRYATLVLFGANPLWVFYAGNGQPDALGILLLLAGIAALIAWRLDGRSRHLVGAGLAMALAMLVAYSFIASAVLIAVAIGALVAGRRGGTAKLESAVLLYATPVAYAALLWTMLNGVILGSPFGWLSQHASFSAVDADPLARAAGPTLGAALHRALEVAAAAAPLALLAVPLLLAAAFLHRDRLSLWLAGLTVLAPAVMVGDALIRDHAGVLVLRDGLVVAAVAVVATAWLHHAVEDWRAVTAPALLGLLALALPLSWHAMRTYPYQDQEQAFTRFVAGGGSQEGTSSIGGFTVGIDPERMMADMIKRTVGDRHDAVLTDNAQTAGVILLSGRPEVFVDRADKGDGEWTAIRDRPYGRVAYMLVATSPADLIRQRYPRIAGAGDPSFTLVFRTRRYVLVRVARHRVAVDATGAAEGAAGTARSMTPRLVTPRTPVTAPSLPAVAAAPRKRTSAPTVEGQ